MAVIYEKASSFQNPRRMLVLDPREGCTYPFEIADWTVLRVGICLSWVRDTETNNELIYPEGATRQLLDKKDSVFVGVKRNTGKFVLDDNDYFLGHFAGTAFDSGDTIHTNFAFGGTSGADTQFVSNVTFGMLHPNGTREVIPSPPNVHLNFTSRTDLTPGSAGHYMFRFEIMNKGQSNQYVNVRSAQASVTDTRASVLQAQMMSASHNDRGTFNFNLDGAPYELPNCFFLYFPFSTIKLRVHALNVIREA